MPAMVILAEYRAAPGREDQVTAAVTEMVSATRAEQGCLEYQAQRDPDQPGRVLLYERYADQAALDAHRASAHFQQLVLGTIVPAVTDRTVTVLEPVEPASGAARPPAALPDQVIELLASPNFAHVVTFRPDGAVHPVVAWVDVDTEPGHVLLNSAEGRVWPANLRRDPRVVVTVADRTNPYQFAVITGQVTETTHDGADAHIDRLAAKYLGQDRYPFRQTGEQRVLFRIRPDHVRIAGGAH